MIGVAVFSFIMGQFIEILLNYNSLWEVGNRKDLSKWIALLSRFNNGKPLNKTLIHKIENFFEHYWNNNKLGALQTDSDIRFMNELPT
jgi:potassium voltage-gated channel Eag-related subfamily H protein 8